MGDKKIVIVGGLGASTSNMHKLLDMLMTAETSKAVTGTQSIGRMTYPYEIIKTERGKHK